MTVKITIRLPDELHERIKNTSDQSRRSLNSEVLWLLERALTEQEEE